MAAELHRVWGDYYAATGDGKRPARHTSRPSRLGGSPRAIRSSGRPGSAPTPDRPRSFSRQKQFDRAAEELRAWQREFPAEKLDGYLTLLSARYWAGRGKHAQAIAQAEQLQAVNPDSPYIDQLLYLAADSEMRLGPKGPRVGHAAFAVERLSRQPAGAEGEEADRDVGGKRQVEDRNRDCSRSQAAACGFARCSGNLRPCKLDYFLWAITIPCGIRD